MNVSVDDILCLFPVVFPQKGDFDNVVMLIVPLSNSTFQMYNRFTRALQRYGPIEMPPVVGRAGRGDEVYYRVSPKGLSPYGKKSTKYLNNVLGRQSHIATGGAVLVATDSVRLSDGCFSYGDENILDSNTDSNLALASRAVYEVLNGITATDYFVTYHIANEVGESDVVHLPASPIFEEGKTNLWCTSSGCKSKRTTSTFTLQTTIVTQPLAMIASDSRTHHVSYRGAPRSIDVIKHVRGGFILTTW
eukprot:CAMPEP_0113844282 /NCGR_PEP_ID=MMETSP0372-20130328/159_1 /TAXON_ID=340204 /ORGANISM="Lankesteria abbotti" /LENGTH=247 /DNA_ID=CAMNT_0000813285 /DNA_START=216 /DNA_END=956 /DNA_ORIENTATION=+ /assembly_acc=CAM_ASM_000359